MAWTVKQNTDGSATLVANGSSKGTEVKIDFGNGAVSALGVSTDGITYLRLINEDGESVYISGNAAQNAVVVAGTPPAAA